jgi:hypothetical protein
LVGKPERKRPRGKLKHRKYIINMELKEIGYEVWTGFIRRGPFMGPCEHGNEI